MLLSLALIGNNNKQLSRSIANLPTRTGKWCNFAGFTLKRTGKPKFYLVHKFSFSGTDLKDFLNDLLMYWCVTIIKTAELSAVNKNYGTQKDMVVGEPWDSKTYFSN